MRVRRRRHARFRGRPRAVRLADDMQISLISHCASIYTVAMRDFVVGFALCGSLMTCVAYTAYKAYEAKEDVNEHEQARRRKRRRQKRLVMAQLAKDRAKGAGAKRCGSGAVTRNIRRPKKRNGDSSELARGTSAAARRTAQLVTDEVRNALGTSDLFECQCAQRLRVCETIFLSIL